MSFKGMAKCKSCKEETIDLKGTYPGLYYECSTCGDIFTATRIFEEKEKAESELNAIRDRVKAVTEEEIKEKLKGNKVLLNRKNGVLETGIIYDVNVLEILNLIKQIGGVK